MTIISKPSESPAKEHPGEPDPMVKWLEEFAESLIHPESPFTQQEIAKLREAAALLAKLGQGWVSTECPLCQHRFIAEPPSPRGASDE